MCTWHVGRCVIPMGTHNCQQTTSCASHIAMHRRLLVVPCHCCKLPAHSTTHITQPALQLSQVHLPTTCKPNQSHAVRGSQSHHHLSTSTHNNAVNGHLPSQMSPALTAAHTCTMQHFPPCSCPAHTPHRACTSSTRTCSRTTAAGPSSALCSALMMQYSTVTVQHHQWYRWTQYSLPRPAVQAQYSLSRT